MGGSSTIGSLATALAERHSQPGPADDGLRLSAYAEWPRHDDWTLRSALVRLAQPEPLLSGALLESARRLDAALHPLSRTLERHLVVCDRALSAATFDPTSVEAATAALPYVDTRAADLARLSTHAGVDGPELAAAYHDLDPLDDEEHEAVGLLAVAVGFDRLSDELTAWAAADPRPEPPITSVDATIRRVVGQLDTMGIPHEADRRPPPRRRAAS
ncbi:MAG: hypothetical protein AAF467_20740 [Actinomycetota bacterium]